MRLFKNIFSKLKLKNQEKLMLDIPVFTEVALDNFTLSKITGTITLKGILAEKFNQRRDRLIVLINPDDSMDPKIRRDARLIIDVSQKNIIDEVHYAINVNKKYLIRRMFTIVEGDKITFLAKPDGLMVFDKYKTLLLMAHQFEVVGRVVDVLPHNLKISENGDIILGTCAL